MERRELEKEVIEKSINKMKSMLDNASFYPFGNDSKIRCNFNYKDEEESLSYEEALICSSAHSAMLLNMHRNISSDLRRMLDNRFQELNIISSVKSKMYLTSLYNSCVDVSSFAHFPLAQTDVKECMSSVFMIQAIYLKTMNLVSQTISNFADVAGRTSDHDMALSDTKFTLKSYDYIGEVRQLTAKIDSILEEAIQGIERIN